VSLPAHFGHLDELLDVLVDEFIARADDPQTKTPAGSSHPAGAKHRKETNQRGETIAAPQTIATAS
jgi:hypothetical protein